MPHLNSVPKSGAKVRTHDGTRATVQAVVVEEHPVHQLVTGFALDPATGLLPGGTLIPTAAGLKPVEDIRVGDFVVPTAMCNGSGWLESL